MVQMNSIDIIFSSLAILVFSMQTYNYLKFETYFKKKELHDYSKRVIPIIVVCYYHDEWQPDLTVGQIHDKVRHRTAWDVVDSIYLKNDESNENMTSLFSDPKTSISGEKHCFTFNATGNFSCHWFSQKPWKCSFALNFGVNVAKPLKNIIEKLWSYQDTFKLIL